MGATFWEYLVPYQPDATRALGEAQSRALRDLNIDLARTLEGRIDDMLASVRWCEEEDKYGLLEHYRDCLDQGCKPRFAFLANYAAFPVFLSL